MSSTFVVPDSFQAFIASAAPASRIRSATGCYVELGQRLVPAADGGWLIHFLSDQQWVLHWLLYLGGDGSHAVVACYPPYGFDVQEDDGHDLYSGETLDVFHPEESGGVVCAETFVEFLYRYWIENEIWFRLQGGDLTDEQRAYLAFYRAS